MSRSQPRKRSYDSTRRRAQAQATRLRILAAAHALFTERGYSGTTIEAIAQHARVAPETVFSAFGSKRALLKSVIGMAVGGDEQATPLLLRPGPQAVLDEPEPARKLELFAQDIADILERVSPLFDVMRIAAKTEAEIDALLQEILDERMLTLGRFVRSLASSHPLREGMTQAQASETVWLVTSPEIYRLLTTDRGWSKTRYAGWLVETLARLLLS